MVRRRPSQSRAGAAPSSSAAGTPSATRSATRTTAQFTESRVHQKVFLDLSARYVEHCRASGTTESAELCAAAERFRRERSLASLIEFADLLERL
ncbi:MAG TPA: hypothetical protein VEB59_03015 [Gemmatimonadales bacterium]|nr:hypothetical protein [Gemmatimonadales bacterium]